MLKKFNPFRGNNKPEVEMNKDELMDLRVQRLSGNGIENMSTYAAPLKPFPESETLSQPFVHAPVGCNLVRGIEFRDDEVPMASPVTGLPVSVPVNTIYPSINYYIAEDMNFGEIRAYNSIQQTYFDNSVRTLFASRMSFLINNILKETGILFDKLNDQLKAEQKQMAVKLDVDCNECNSTCYENDKCINNRYVNAFIVTNKFDIFNLLPQLIDIDFYNMIKAHGIDANEEQLEVLGMAFASILENRIRISAIDEVSFAHAMDLAHGIIIVATDRLVGTIKEIIAEDNISNLIEYDSGTMWKTPVFQNDIVKHI